MCIEKHIFVRKQILISLILIYLLVISCLHPTGKHQESTPLNQVSNGYQPPVIPLMLNSPEQKSAFLVEHYWDNFDFKDTSQLKDITIQEQIFADFLGIVTQVSPQKASHGIKILMNRAEISQNTSLFFYRMAEKYLFHPNSPLRNDSLYEKFLELACGSMVIDSVSKFRFQKQYEMAQRNKPGHKATDFNFTLKNGSHSMLYHINAGLLLLYFYNPECAECKVIRSKLTQSKLILQLEAKGLIRILSLYTDKELNLWENHYSELPGSWINGYDKGTVIQQKELYDLKAIPSLYLLGGDKTVLLRDATIEQIEGYLQFHGKVK
ncbi:MAG: DUF5106 domain-containing protein [Mariniphaga sp.]